jgi:transposase
VRRRPETRAPEEEPLLVQLTTPQAELAAAVTLARDFADRVRTRQPDRLDGWLARATRRAVDALPRVAQGVRDDDAAVNAGGTWPWSHGPVEGHITRVKMLKRQMCGRAPLDLLSRRFVRASRGG